MAAKKNKTPKKSVKPVKPVEPEESSEDSSSESEEMEVEAPVMKTKKLTKSKETLAKKKAESSDSEEEEEEEEESSEDEESDSDEEEEEEDEEDDEDEDDDEEEEKGKVKKPVAAAESSDSDEEDFSEEETSEGSKEAKKRKKEMADGKNAKKAKVDEPVTVLCRNVPQEVTIEKLEKFLKKKGIAFTSVRKRNDRMFAHIDLANPDDLDTVLATKDLEYKGSTLAFEKGRPLGASKPERTKEDDSKSLFVKNLSFDDSEDSIRSNLSEIFPGAQNVRLPFRGNTHRGFAYIEFSSAEEVKDAVENKQGVACGDQKLFLDYASGSSKKRRGGFRDDQPEESSVLLVRNLSYDSTEDSLRSCFKDATDVRIPIFSDTGKPKGIAFVEFESTSKAKNALNKHDDTNIDGRNVRCYFARSRGEGDGRSGGYSGGRRGGGSGGFGRRGGGGGGKRYGGGGGQSSFGGTGKKKTFSDSD
ncbi:nucleolin isoform X2 [Octopus bimaculoides]|uniref:nucleolin isoform X2 n=1 Tax=Octopus bimaculoides TaxID=37653 RepID=UPI0022E7BED0|nr:nucleolin isoform X2 [Octopus bimaculoides]